MKKIRSRIGLCSVVLAIFLAGILVLLNTYRKNASEWFLTPYNRHLYSSENVLLTGTIADRNGVVLSYVKNGERRYHANADVRMSTLHVVGDPYGKIGASALATMRDDLVSFSAAKGISSVDEAGNTVVLTIDAKLNAAALEALDGRNGTVCVYNYKTGEILALVSTPTFDPSDIPEDIEENPSYAGVYMNRFLSTTATPGSVLKPVILQAALESGLQASDLDPAQSGPLIDWNFTCKGVNRFPDGYVNCPKVHGKQSLIETLADSCNCAYATLAVALGPDTVSEGIRKSGLTDSYKVGTVNTAHGAFRFTGIYDYQLGYAGVGLYLDQVNPCSLLVYYAAIAGGGRAAVPNTVLEIRDENGKLLRRPETELTRELLDASTAEYLRKALSEDVRLSYGTDRFPCAIAAKSGTVSQSKGASNCWFAGFTTDEDKPYAFVVYLEHGGTGSRAAGDVAAAVLSHLVP
jgi:Cell division protein FtsI/penicillin-binding protein 2